MSNSHNGLQEGCSTADIQQSLPQDPEHFATSTYDVSTACAEVKTPQKRPNSYTRRRSLNFLSILIPAVQALPYTVCSDTSWKVISEVGVTTNGPLNTFVFFDNTCQVENGTATFQVTATRNPGACQPHLLQEQCMYTTTRLLLHRMSCPRPPLALRHPRWCWRTHYS